MKRPTPASLKKVTPERLAVLGAERLAEILATAAAFRRRDFATCDQLTAKPMRSNQRAARGYRRGAGGSFQLDEAWRRLRRAPRLSMNSEWNVPPRLGLPARILGEPRWNRWSFGAVTNAP